MLNSTAVSLIWNPPETQKQNGIIQKYIISLFEVANDISEEIIVIGSTSAIVEGLHPHYDYDISVSAFTVAPGPDAVVSITTNEDGKTNFKFFDVHFIDILIFFLTVPSSAPLNVSLSDITSTSISIRWFPPPIDQQNGVIRHYIVSIEEVATATSITLNTTDVSVTLENLHPNYEYLFNIAAVTIGAGPSNYGNFKLLEDSKACKICPLQAIILCLFSV